MKKRILFLVPYPPETAPSQRFRFEHFFKYFSQRGISYDLYSFWSERAWLTLYKEGYPHVKFYHLVAGFLRRMLVFFHLRKYDFVFVHREVTPIGPPIFEFLIARWFKKKVIYDFDDAIWLANTSQANKIAARLKNHGKVRNVCRWSWKVSVGNDFLAHFARKYSSNVIRFPTVVDTQLTHNTCKVHTSQRRPVIGWTGTHSTSIYLKMLVGPLKQLRKEVSFDFLVISNQPPELELEEVRYLPWSKEQEIEQLLQIDVGVMPLKDHQWEHGKCGFKLIQYLSLGIPAVASPVGVNTMIIDHETNGYLARNDDEWIKYLFMLLTDAELRNNSGKEGRRKIEDHYSVEANVGRFFSIFE